MLLDYVGQELIWRLRCNHPYELNRSSCCIRIRAHSPKANQDIVDFIMRHIKREWLVDVEKEPTPFVCGDEEVVSCIKIKTVFDRVSELRILNEEIGYYE